MHVETTVEIDAPPSEVWATLSDVVRWPEWTASMSEVQPLEDGPLALGSKVRIKQPRMPPLTWEITEFDPGRSFSWQSTSPGITTVGTHRLEPLPNGGTAVTLAIHGSGGLAPIGGLLMAGRIRRYVTMEALGLGLRCEGGRP
jgi:uncharacterized membrane protein